MLSKNYEGLCLKTAKGKTMGYDEMEQVGPYLRRFFNDHNKRWYYYHLCPACDEPHQYTLLQDNIGWTFNHDYQKPSFYPSMRRSSNIPRTPEERTNRVEYTTCHYFLIEGRIDYCTDSPHHLAGKSVPLPVWPKNK
jgi:hypothetical protein